MPRMKRHTVEKVGDWSEETPNMDNYRMGCCDCGLVHDIQFRAIKVSDEKPDGTFMYETLDPKEYRVEIRVRRNNRSTAQVRRHKKPNASGKPTLRASEGSEQGASSAVGLTNGLCPGASSEKER